MTDDKNCKINLTNKECIDFLENFYWGDEKICPYCNSRSSTQRIATSKIAKKYHCNSCNTDYTVLVNTIFQNTKIPLQKWFEAIYIISNTTKKISTRHLAQKIFITKDTASRMLKNIEKFDEKEKMLQKLKEIIERKNNEQKGKKFYKNT